MSRIWTVLVIASVAIALIMGRTGDAAEALLGSGDEAVALLLTLLATLTLWSGLMEILDATGDVARLGRLFRRVARPLFPGLSDDASWAAMGMNLSANLLGLGNAATPAGIQAARLLSAQGETGLRALAMLLAIDNASLQLMPTTVITLRQSAGSAAPADIWAATLITSAIASAAAIVLMTMLNRGGKQYERIFRRRGDQRGRLHRSAGADGRH